MPVLRRYLKRPLSVASYGHPWSMCILRCSVWRHAPHGDQRTRCFPPTPLQQRVWRAYVDAKFPPFPSSSSSSAGSLALAYGKWEEPLLLPARLPHTRPPLPHRRCPEWTLVAV
eukprot:GGOE01012081.1.p4 GENE.GGOE01012081.1~~GGOE01012081.1.p4  ORF type:complete len:114 (-),score=0.37 GGOE01012081.1:75-416(-)